MRAVDQPEKHANIGKFYVCKDPSGIWCSLITESYQAACEPMVKARHVGKKKIQI